MIFGIDINKYKINIFYQKNINNIFINKLIYKLLNNNINYYIIIFFFFDNI